VAYYVQASTDSRFVLRNSAETLTATFYSGETATDADGAVTIGIVDAAGATVVASGTSTTKTATGVYTYSLAGQSNLKQMTVTWSGTWGSAMSFTTTTEVVGNFYTTPAEVRALDMIAGESSTFPAADLVAAINYSTAVIDDFCGASFVQRYQRDVLNGNNDQTIRVTQMFPETLLSASVNGTALSASEVSNCALFEDGSITRKDSVWTFTEPGNLVVIEYEHGAGTEAPEDIRWCARTLARYHLLEQVSRIPDRAVQVQSEFGSITLSQPGGHTRPTPLNDVNVLLNRHRHRPPVAF
jgi:hypothetical protein